MEESTKHEKPPKYGALVYDGSQKVQEAEIGYYICPVCQEKSKLIQRQAPGFKNILSVCMRGHTCELVKTLYEKYKVNDRIRQYSSTFGKEARIRLDTYCEGTIAALESYAKSHNWDIAPDNREGIRISFPENDGDGWFLLRLSLHDPLIPLNIESDSVGGVHTIAAELAPVLKQFDQLDTAALLAFAL